VGIYDPALGWRPSRCVDTTPSDVAALAVNDACSERESPEGAPRSPRALHVYLETSRPRIGEGGTMEGTIWFQNETDGPLEVWLDPWSSMNQLVDYVVADAHGFVVDAAPSRVVDSLLGCTTGSSRKVRVVIPSGERVEKSFRWKAAWRVWSPPTARCAASPPVEGPPLPAGEYTLVVMPPVVFGAGSEAAGAKIDGVRILVGASR
jgi:hypothetical protein